MVLTTWITISWGGGGRIFSFIGLFSIFTPIPSESIHASYWSSAWAIVGVFFLQLLVLFFQTAYLYAGLMGCGAAAEAAWALFVLLLSTLLCCQLTELIWAFGLNFPILLPPPPREQSWWSWLGFKDSAPDNDSDTNGSETDLLSRPDLSALNPENVVELFSGSVGGSLPLFYPLSSVYSIGSSLACPFIINLLPSSVSCPLRYLYLFLYFYIIFFLFVIFFFVFGVSGYSVQYSSSKFLVSHSHQFLGTL